mgnify:CR=1 FL=1
MSKSEEYKGYVYEIHVDTDPPNPGDWDNLGEIAYLLRSRHVLGTKAVSDAEMREIHEGLLSGRYIGLDVYAYVHSGVTIRAASRNPFTCPWDSGQSGFVYVETSKALKEYGRKRMSPKLKAQVQEVLRREVETFDQYMRGDVYFYAVRRNGDIIDTCSGIFGLDEAEKQAKEFIDAEDKAENERIANMQQQLPI